MLIGCVTCQSKSRTESRTGFNQGSDVIGQLDVGGAEICGENLWIRFREAASKSARLTRVRPEVGEVVKSVD